MPNPDTEAIKRRQIKVGGLAVHFHEAYERLAPTFGWMTQEASAVEWRDLPTQQKLLMEAVVNEVCGPLLAALDAAERDYAQLAEHHRQCKLAGTELCEAAKEAIVYAADGPSRDRLNAAMMAWDAHQWPEIINAEMEDEQ